MAEIIDFLRYILKCRTKSRNIRNVSIRLTCFQRDLEERKNGFFDFGDEFDKANWMNFLDAVNKEIDRRKTRG